MGMIHHSKDDRNVSLAISEVQKQAEFSRLKEPVDVIDLGGPSEMNL